MSKRSGVSIHLENHALKQAVEQFKANAAASKKAEESAREQLQKLEQKFKDTIAKEAAESAREKVQKLEKENKDTIAKKDQEIVKLMQELEKAKQEISKFKLSIADADAKREKDMEPDDDYTEYGEAWQVADKFLTFDSILPTNLFCGKCQQIYDHVLTKDLVSKSCSFCGEWQKEVLSCRRHSLCACSKECAQKLAEKHGFSLLHFDGAYKDADGKIQIPEYHL